MGKSVFVTGAGGYIGKFVIEALAKILIVLLH